MVVNGFIEQLSDLNLAKLMYRCCLIIYLNLLLFMYVCGVLCVPKNIIKPKLKSAEVKLDYKYINLACLNFFLSLNSVLFHRITDH